MAVNSVKQAGFTLIEMLVAVAILAIASVAAVTGLTVTLDARERMVTATEDIIALQRAFIYFEQDINLLADRPIRDSFGTGQPALVRGELDDGRILEFSRRGWPNPAELPKSDLARVAYDLVEDEAATARQEPGEPTLYKLYRLYWRDIDRAVEEPNRRRRIASGLFCFKAVGDHELGKDLFN